MTYVIRNMKREEMDLAISWAAVEGWNPGLNDGECFFNADPDGFFVGELDGEIIACKSAVRYNNTFGFMGFYIVKDGYRNKGYGIKIWKHAFNRLKDIISGMDGVVQQQANYMKSGYKLAYRQIRFEGKDIKGKTSPGILDLGSVQFEKIVEYDSGVFQAPRKVFLTNWFNQPNISAKAFVQDEKVLGYGVIRSCRKGYKIGPLFADTPLIAERIFLSLADYAAGKEIYLDTPEINYAALSIAKNYNMKYVFETARMYHNGNPDKDTNKVFGVTTFELG